MTDQQENKDEADPLVEELAREGFAARKTSTREVAIYLKEHDSPSKVTVTVYEHGFVLRHPQALPDESEFGAKIQAMPAEWFVEDDQ